MRHKVCHFGFGAEIITPKKGDREHPFYYGHEKIAEVNSRLGDGKFVLFGPGRGPFSMSFKVAGNRLGDDGANKAMTYWRSHPDALDSLFSAKSIVIEPHTAGFSIRKEAWSNSVVPFVTMERAKGVFKMGRLSSLGRDKSFGTASTTAIGFPVEIGYAESIKSMVEYAKDEIGREQFDAMWKEYWGFEEKRFFDGLGLKP